MISVDVQQSNIHVIRTALDSALAGRLDDARPFFADDFVLYEAKGLPFGGVYRGWEGYKEILGKLHDFWIPGRKQASREFVPYGDDKVIIHFTLEGRIAKNGQHVAMPVLALWELKDGKIASVRPFYFDTKRFADLAAK